MILLADSGSTKTDWALLSKNGIVLKAKTQGFNPYYQTSEDISQKLRAELLPQLNGYPPEEIHYYGAGCSTTEKCDLVARGLATVFPHATLHIEHDLLAAARALCGREAGIACILGTGSNSCHFNGERIVEERPNLGFMLGDEGSGGYMGKRLVQAYLNLELPAELHEKFHKRYPVERNEIIDQVYTKPFPNRYMASFTRFLGDNREHPFAAKLIRTCLDDFFTKNICKYEGHTKLPVHFVGSVAYYYAEELREVAKNHSVTIGRILENPMQGLIEYHS